MSSVYIISHADHGPIMVCATAQAAASALPGIAERLSDTERTIEWVLDVVVEVTKMVLDTEYCSEPWREDSTNPEFWWGDDFLALHGVSAVQQMDEVGK